MDDVARDLREIHALLRRSAARGANPTGADELRTRVRDSITRGRAHFEAGRLGKAIGEMREALALEPASEEAAELMWRAGKKLYGGRPEAPPPDPATAQRVEALLAQAAPGRPREDVQRALAELALVAPDDPRVLDLMRERGAER
jgi:hypothetical protein